MKEVIVYKRVDELKGNPKNPRKNDGAVDSVAKSIDKYGFKNPLIIDVDNIVWCGNTRLKAAKKLGLEEVPCIVVKDLTPKQMEEYALLDNKTNEIAEWDFDLLNEILPELDLDDFDLDWGLPELVEEEKEVEEDDFDCTPPEQPKAKLGDIYQLGNHRLMCGDSTKEEDVAKLMDGIKADMVFTDPPYGMKKEKDGVLNDNLNFDDLLEFNKQWIPLTFDALKDNGSWYCWGIDEPLMDIYSNILKPMANENKITFRNLITWDKGSGQGQMNKEFKMYPIADEKCIFVMSGVQNLILNAENYWNGYDKIRNYLETEAKKVGLNASLCKNICGVGMYNHWFTKSQFQVITKESYEKLQDYYKGRAFNKQYEELRKQYEELRAYFDNTHDNMNNVWHFDRTSTKERELTGGHATPKPIALCSRAIKSSSRENEKVLDVFGGSGSTLIACEQLNRNCYMMELDPKYVDVIIARWEQFTGKKAEKIC